jgi:peroxiredoxin
LRVLDRSPRAILLVGLDRNRRIFEAAREFGFQVVGVSMDDSANTTKQTMQEIRFNYPVVMGDAKLGNLYGGVLGLPLQFLVGADGKIRPPAEWRECFTLEEAVADAPPGQDTRLKKH